MTQQTEYMNLKVYTPGLKWVKWSSISKSVKSSFHFSNFLSYVLQQDPTERDQLALKTSKIIGNRNDLFLFGYILKSVFASSKSLYLITSHISQKFRFEFYFWSVLIVSGVCFKAFLFSFISPFLFFILLYLFLFVILCF